MQSLKLYLSLSLSLLFVSCQSTPVQVTASATQAPLASVSPHTITMQSSEPEVSLSNETPATPTPEMSSSPNATVVTPSAAPSQVPLPSGPCVALGQCFIHTFSGDGIEGYQGDDQQTPHHIRFRNPSYMATDAKGNVYISDTDNHRVRMIEAETGFIKTVAGNGVVGFNGDSGQATQAQLNTPKGLTLDNQGNLYIVDSKNHRVRRVNLKMGTIETVVGNGFQGYIGDDVLPENSALNLPQGITFDGQDALYIADHNNQRIRKYSLTENTIETVVGNGTEGFTKDGENAKDAALRNPTHLILSGDALYFSEAGNQRIRKVNLKSGRLSTLVGSGDQGFNANITRATRAPMRTPAGLYVSQDQLYFVDRGNHRIRRVDLTSGTLSDVAGIGSAGFSGDKNDAKLSELKFPLDLSMNHKGELLVLDSGNQRVRVLQHKGL